MKTAEGYRARRSEPPPPSTTRARPGRPRNLSTDQKILAAARELLKERGYDATSFEAIAQRAGVTRPSIYRRWSSKTHLISEILIRGPGLAHTLSESEIGEKIRSFLHEMVEVYGQPEMKAGLAGLVSSYQASPDLRMELEGATEAKARKDFESIIREHQEKGDVRREIASDTLFDMIVGAVFYRFLGSSFEASPDFVTEICEIILRGIRPAQNPDRSELPAE